MKIAVPVLGPGPDLMMDERFGRARFFWIYDSNSKKGEVIENPGYSAATAAGPAAVQTLKDAGVEVLLAANVGPKARDMLVAAKIEYYEIKPQDAQKAVEAFLKSRGL